jgi:hypothetical protein
MIENLGYDSSKGLSLVMEKHGTHDQKTHGNWANSWATGARTTPDDKWLIDNFGDKTTFTRNDPNGLLRFSIPNSLIDDPRYQETIQISLDTLEKLQDAYPLTTQVAFVAGGKTQGGYLGETFSASVDGVPAPSKIFLTEDLLKPSAEKDLLVHTIVHEWGHAQDWRTPEKAKEQGARFSQAKFEDDSIPMTDYGWYSDREAYAEAFAIKFNGAHKGGVWSQNVPQTDKWEEVFKIFELDSVKKAKGERVSFLVKDTFDANNPPVLIENYKEPVSKHGSHDQKTHGNWATGMGAGVADSILTRVRENGGLSVNMVDGSEPTSGYMVAKGSQYGSIVDAVDFYDPVKGPKALADYMKKHKDQLGGGKNYLGLWHNTADGKVYLDVSENIQSKERAISAGQKQDQISIWDVVNFAEIETGGTGSVEKTGSSRTASEYLRNERFGDRGIRPENLGEVSKAYKVIKFAAGLIPTFKHLQGQHDQSTHGAWANGGYSDEQANRIAAMENVGLSIEDLNSLAASMEQADMSDLKMMVENDQGLYNQAIDGIEERVAALVEESKYEYEDTEANNKANEALYNRLFEQVQNEMVDDFIQNDDGSLAQLWQDQNYGEMNQDDLLNSLNEVYGFEYTGKNPDGVDVSLRAEMNEITSIDGNTLSFRGQIFNEYDDEVGRIERTFYRNETGGWNVEHDYFKIDDDESQGTGFGAKWIERQEDWYIAQGFDAITVGTAWDGARHWARAGYDFDPKERRMEQNVGELLRSIRFNGERFAVGTESRTEFDNLMSRVLVGYVKGEELPSSTGPFQFHSFTNDDFPIPADFANIGINRKSTLSPFPNQPPTNTWDGKVLMGNLNMKYKKVLTAEGTSIQQGPIDRDGDGMVYDGTAREKPAPSK